MPRVWRAWDPLWARRDALGGELLTLAGLVVLLGVNGFGYPTVARIAAWRGVTVWDPTTPLDLWIPALPWTVAIYSTMYLYLPFGVLSAPRSDAGRRELLLHVQCHVALVGLSYLFFLSFPVEIHLAASMKERLAIEPSWIRALFAGIYAVDRPWNAWPSLHVSQSLFVVLCLQHWWSADSEPHRPWTPSERWRRPASFALWAAWVALALSILTTKQHFVWDGITGVLLGLFVWRALFRPAIRGNS
jgi:hypothetical protein